MTLFPSLVSESIPLIGIAGIAIVLQNDHIANRRQCGGSFEDTAFDSVKGQKLSKAA